MFSNQWVANFKSLITLVSSKKIICPPSIEFRARRSGCHEIIPSAFPACRNDNISANFVRPGSLAVLASQSEATISSFSLAAIKNEFAVQIPIKSYMKSIVFSIKKRKGAPLVRMMRPGLSKNGERFLFCPYLLRGRCNYPFRELEAPPWFSDYCLAEKHSSRSSCTRGCANCFSSSTGTPISFAALPNSRMLFCPRLRMRCFTTLRAISPCRLGSSIGPSFQSTDLPRNLRSQDSQVHLLGTPQV